MPGDVATLNHVWERAKASRSAVFTVRRPKRITQLWTLLTMKTGASYSIELMNSFYLTSRSLSARRDLFRWVDAKLSAMTAGSFSSKGFVRNQRFLTDAVSQDVMQSVDRGTGCKKKSQEQLWRELLSDPSKWKDHRSYKGNSKFPDFKHKETQAALWLNSKWKPPWVEAKLAEIAPEAFESSLTSTNTRLLRYVKAGQYEEAFKLFQQMHQCGISPDRFTFNPVLKACSSLGLVEEGRRIHNYIIQNGYESDHYLGTGLIEMYANCGCIKDAWIVFSKMAVRDVICWNVMILGYMKCGQAEKAFDLYHQMQHEGVDPNPITFVGMLNACASLMALDEGRHIHKKIIQKGYGSDVFVGSSLVDMYSKSGSIEDALAVFNEMPTRNVVSWTAMILGYVKCGEGQKALEMSRRMQLEGVEPNSITFVGILNACASLMALEGGRQIHDQIVQKGFESDVFVRSSLIDMYAKCGNLEDAFKVFNKVAEPDVVSCNAMLGGYAVHGQVKEALGLFRRMSQGVVEVNEVTFVCLLSACSHGGLVDEGLHFFQTMNAKYDVSPNVNHLACIVDLLGRAGRLQEAEDLIKNMPYKPSVSVWRSLLGSSRLHGNLEMGELGSNQVVELNPENASGYVLLSNIHAAVNKSKGDPNPGRQKLESGEPGCAWIEVNSNVHSFLEEDSRHPQIEEIYAELKRLLKKIKEGGFLTDTSKHEKKEEIKMFYLCCHSEMLAIAFGYLSTPRGMTLRIAKNLPVCDVCHTASKLLSKLVERTLIVRDSSRVHHFKDDLCSCNDNL